MDECKPLPPRRDAGTAAPTLLWHGRDTTDGRECWVERPPGWEPARVATAATRTVAIEAAMVRPVSSGAKRSASVDAVGDAVLVNTQRIADSGTHQRRISDPLSESEESGLSAERGFRKLDSR